jgi:hypothetical protein
VARTQDGSTVAEPALPPNTPLLEMVLNSSGTQVAWSEWGWRLDTIMQVTIEEVATGAIIGQLPYTGTRHMVEELAFSPDDRFLFGNEWNADGNRSLPSPPWKWNRILIWELMSGKLALCLSGKGFARGLGAHGELAVIRPAPNADVVCPARGSLADWARMGNWRLFDQRRRPMIRKSRFFGLSISSRASPKPAWGRALKSPIFVSSASRRRGFCGLAGRP